MLTWIWQLHQTNPTAQAIAIIAFVCVAGMSLGRVKVRGIKLGTSGVLFAAILMGHFAEPVDRHTLEFLKEFGLILFVSCIGLQLGPGFFSSLRQSGMLLNLLALAIVLFGAALAVGLGRLMSLDEGAILGVFSGATTNTPSLGAAQQTLATYPGVSHERQALPALAYAVTYPAGIAGIIGTLMGLRALFRIDLNTELEAYHASESRNSPPLERRTLVVENLQLQGVPLGEVPGLHDTKAVISRLRRVGESLTTIAAVHVPLSVGDCLHVVGTAQALDRLQSTIGRAIPENLATSDGPVKSRKIVVTRRRVLGKSLRELHLEQSHEVVVTTITRGEVELLVAGDLKLRFGDVLQVVGPATGLQAVASELGNSLEALNETQFVPLFAGIGMGILLGTMPIPCPGLPQPLRFGLAGGPLIVAILVGRAGHIGRLVWHMPRNANLAFRELGISMFFAAVGLLAGPTFFSAACSLSGLLWLMAGIVVTTVPLLLVGVFARQALAMNFVTIAGLLAGSMTDPPALAFASNICRSESPAVAYATVYPLTMLLRIMAAQALAVTLCG